MILLTDDWDGFFASHSDELIVPPPPKKKSHKFFNYFHDASKDILSHQKINFFLFYYLVLHVAYLNISFKGYEHKKNIKRITLCYLIVLISDLCLLLYFVF